MRGVRHALADHVAVAFERKTVVELAQFEAKVFERCFVADQRFGFAYCRTLSDEYRVDLLLLLKFSLQKRERNKDRARTAPCCGCSENSPSDVRGSAPLTLRRIVFPGSSLRPD